MLMKGYMMHNPRCLLLIIGVIITKGQSLYEYSTLRNDLVLHRGKDIFFAVLNKIYVYRYI